VLDFIHDNAKVVSATQVLLADSRVQNPGYSQMFPKDFLGMHVSSFFGLQQTMNSELENGAKPDLKDSDCQLRPTIEWARGPMVQGRRLSEQERSARNPTLR